MPTHPVAVILRSQGVGKSQIENRKSEMSSVPSVEPPYTREEIIAALERLHTESAAYWNAFSIADFFKPLGTAWSPADNVRHLNKATRPVANALRVPRLILGLRFGVHLRSSMSYETVVKKYQAQLAEGAQAGPFAPSSRREDDEEIWRRRIMSDRDEVKQNLVHAVQGWSEGTLDRYQLPHPLLGKLTVREMLYFTLYHQLHHVLVVERRLK